MFRKFNEQTLLWEENKKKKFLFFSLIIILMINSFLFGLFCQVESVEKIFQKTLITITYELPKDMNTEFVDSLFLDYEKRANTYLSQKKFEKSPIKGFMLSTCAKDAYLITGIFLPVELALAQAQMESNMGTTGRSPISNPFNVGEYDSGTVMTFDNTYQGITSYYKYMTQEYLKCRPIDVLLRNFTNCGGKRYAQSTNYENNISALYFKIKKYIDKKS